MKIDNSPPYKWTKFRNGIGMVAIVSIEVIPNADKNEVIEHYYRQGFTSQGYIEDVPEDGYNSWKLAARNALEYGFSLVETFSTVHINKIEGRSFTDTNPTVVGYTVLRAFLDKVGYDIDAQQIERLEEFVMNSWTKPYKELIPDFFTLTFTEYKPD